MRAPAGASEAIPVLRGVVHPDLGLHERVQRGPDYGDELRHRREPGDDTVLPREGRGEARLHLRCSREDQGHLLYPSLK